METSTSTPHLIGGCRIVEKLGQGGMGAVYLAKHQTLGRQVALKLLPQQFTANPEYVQRFLREARAAAQLRHPNIVQVYDAGEQGGQYYISMEFVEGESLAARLKKTGAAPEGQALSWLKQAADGLAAAHKLGLVHRDIKPENLLLEKDGTLKIADFGLVSAVEGEGDSALTQSGAMLGTPLYMSPEQCEGHKADGRSDLYSLGAAFFRVLTGSVAFTAPTPVGVMYKHRYEAPPHPRSINPTLNEPACQVILRLMAKDPAHRFQSAEEVAVSVGALLNDTPTLRPGQLPASYTPAPGGATPLPPGLSPAHTPTMLHAQSPALLNAQTPQPPGVVLGQTSVPTSMTTLAQPPRRNPLAWAAVILLSLGLLGAGGFFGWQMYHEKKIGEFKQKYQDAFSVKQYEDAIRVANAAAAAYPERDEFPAFRDRAEVAWVVDDVARLKAKAETSKKLEKYDEAIDALAAAIKRQEEKRALPGLVPDDTLADLKTWAERKRDERDALAQAGVAEKEERYTDAAALYEKAQGLADTDDARLRARQSANRVNFQHHAGLAALYVKNAQWPEALAEWQAAAKFEHKDVSNEIRTAERRIRHAELLADANRLNASGNLREAAKRFDEAANVAESESEAKGLREQAAQLLQDAAFNENLAKGNAALERRDWKAAQEALQAASLARPGDPSLAPKLAKAAAGAWADQADAEFEKKNWAAAYASYRKAADADPSDKELARKAADAKLLVDRIESTQAAAQQAEGARRWTEAANAWNSLAALDPNEADRYETRSKNAQFEAAMLKAENLRANGKEEEAAQAALNAIPIFPAGAERARAFAESVRRQQVAEEKKPKPPRTPSTTPSHAPSSSSATATSPAPSSSSARSPPRTPRATRSRPSTTASRAWMRSSAVTNSSRKRASRPPAPSRPP
ncbi:MAG: protein kinase [Planctomycetota bacterium]|nr:protein kinase [Planctomycetota bacterium]